MTNKIDHSDLGKHPEVIKKAQKELLNMDVLVCGGCHAAFHFVKDFGDHKENCSGTVPKDHPEIKENWAFHLWKSSQANKDDENPWTLYKSWALLSKPQQLAWISAGQSLQSISRIGQGSVQETQVRVVRTVPDFKVSAVAGGVTKGPGIVTPTRVISTVSAEKKKEEASPATGGGDAGSKQHIVKRTMNVVGNRTEVRELPAERILSRRMNTKRNMYEYQVKWVNAALKNTWEPRTHFDKAPEMLEDCEMKLARAKLNMAGGAVTSASPVTPTSPGRPVRNSKSRAMDQVKQWCNTEEKGQALAAELKRKITDSDFAEAEDSSQDEGGSPKPKQFKASPQFEKKVVGGQVRYYQKSANGPLTPMNNPTADVRLATAADKQTGVLRKPGMVNKSPVKREAQVRVVGKNETTSSGIVRVAGSQLTSPQSSTPPPGTRMQKVIQTTRLPNGETVKRTVMRAVPITTPSPAVNKPGVTRTVVQASTIGRSPVQQFQAKRAATQPTVTYKVSPNGNANRVVRQQVTTPLVNRVVRTVPTAAATTPKAPAEDSEDMVLCPVTGKLISKSAADADGAELERLLTDDEKASQGGDGNTSAAEGEAGAGQDTQIQQLIENEDGSPVMVTGDDGTIYQVAGKNAEGQTLLIAQGAEGEQSCVFVAASEEAGGDQGGDSAQADGSGSSSGTASATSGDGATPGSQDGESGEEGAGGSQAMMVDQDSQDGQITAELVQADEPSADGTRRVVLLLPDGNLMVSEVNEEQYQQFNLGA